MIAFTPRAGNVKAAVAAAAVTAVIYVFVHRVMAKPIDKQEIGLWAFGAFISMFILGV